MKKYLKYALSITIIISISLLSYSYYYSHFIYHYYKDNSKVGSNRLTLKEVTTTPTKSSILQNNSTLQQVFEKNKQHVCGNNRNGSTFYITEYVLPVSCSQPVGLAVDKNNNIWIAAGWVGDLFVFDPTSNTFIKTIPLPNWHSVGLFGSMIWDMKFDNNGNLWFTDEKSNSIWKYFTKENKFEQYKLPTHGGYPVSLVFDSNGKVWFTEIFGKKLAVLDPSKVQNGSTNGISELNLTKYISFDTTGPLSNNFAYHNQSNNSTAATISKNILWFTTVNYPFGGQVVKYDIANNHLTVYDLTNEHTIPLSISEDESGRVWTNDHASSLFLMLDPSTGYTKQYATSFPLTVNTTTLPYYNEYRDGKIWFNEHYGNAIAFFNMKNNTLVEFHIPTEDKFWGNASNPLRFIFDKNGSIWFTEWTENKIGVVHKDKINLLPISISTSKDKMVLDRAAAKGDTVDIFIHKNNSNIDQNNNFLLNQQQLQQQKPNKISNITMFATSSISKIGALSNLTSKFSKDVFFFSVPPANVKDNVSSPLEIPYKTTLAINPTKYVTPGNYTLTISARYNNEVTVSKIIDLDIK